MSLLLCATLFSSSQVAQWCRTSQITLGSAITNATSAPSQIHFCPRWRRSGVSTIPITRAAPKNAMECLFSSPSPAATPNHNHSRGRSPLARRASSQAQPIQNSGSKAFMVSRLSPPRYTGADKQAAQASATAHIFPPNSRTSSAVSATLAAAARAGKNRMALRESPSARDTRATTAISGG